MNPNFVKPLYDSRGFAGLPVRIKSAFRSGQYDAVVLFLIDGFGWRFYERFRDSNFIQHISQNGRIEKLTSQFPSTTAAHLPTIHTGVPVGQSGMHEWFYYEPLADTVIAPLLFSYAGRMERDNLKGLGISPSGIYPNSLFYPALKEMGVDSFFFGPKEYTPSTFSNVVMKGASMRPYSTFSESLINLKELLVSQRNPTYVHLYFDKIDALCHSYGPTSSQVETEIESFLSTMEQNFERVFKGNKRVLFLMTADHGMAEVDPKKTVFLNTDSSFNGIDRFIKTNKAGKLIVPAGSARDMFLYIKDEQLEDAREFLSSRLEGKADVVKTEALIMDGYFGPDVSSRFRERAGNLIILPYLNETVWWYEKGKFDMKFLGHHGGLTSQEMETVIYTCEI